MADAVWRTQVTSDGRRPQMMSTFRRLVGFGVQLVARLSNDIEGSTSSRNRFLETGSGCLRLLYSRSLSAQFWRICPFRCTCVRHFQSGRQLAHCGHVGFLCRCGIRDIRRWFRDCKAPSLGWHWIRDWWYRRFSYSVRLLVLVRIPRGLPVENVQPTARAVASPSARRRWLRRLHLAGGGCTFARRWPGQLFFTAIVSSTSATSSQRSTAVSRFSYTSRHLMMVTGS